MALYKRGLYSFASGSAPPSYDSDAQTYFTAVEAADGSTLETGYKDAVNTLVVSLKSASLWTPINRLFLFSTAKTLAGVAVPLKGAAPTALVNYVIGDYNRKTGLKGDGTTEYVNTGYADSDSPQNDNHIAIWDSDNIASGTGNKVGTGTTRITDGNTTRFMANRGTNTTTGLVSNTQFTGMSRNNSANFTARVSSTNVTLTVTSTTPFTGRPYYLSAFNGNPTPNSFSTSRIAIASFGTSLDLAALQTIFATYMTTIGAL